MLTKLQGLELFGLEINSANLEVFFTEKREDLISWKKKYHTNGKASNTDIQNKQVCQKNPVQVEDIVAKNV